jgi:hypothetical protein
MGRPKAGYQLDGERVPGVTTISGRYKDPGGLLMWAWQQGRDGKDFRETRDAAADAGTCVHAMVESDWHQTAFDRSLYQPEALEKADHAYLGYIEWKLQTNLTIIKPELTLISRRHRFGGTLDAVMIGGKLSIGDYKSSNGVYADMLVQVAGGYSLLWAEHYPEQPLHGMQLIRFSKPKHPDDPISFHHHYWSAEIFPIAQPLFLHFREAYELEKRIKGLL